MLVTWVMQILFMQSAQAGEVVWEDGLELRSDVGSLEVAAVIQPRAEALVADDEVEGASMFMRRTRLTLEGALYEVAGFKLQVGWDRGQAQLKDAWLSVFLGEDTALWVGQQKRLYSRSFITSGTALALPDRSVVENAFDIGRDLGVQLVHASDTEAAIGIFDGTGDSARLRGDVVVDPDTGVGTVDLGSRSHVPEGRAHPVITGRIGRHSSGMRAFDEIDFERGPLRIAGAAQGLLHFDLDDDDESAAEVGVDGMLKASGLTLTAEGFLGFVGDGELDMELDRVGAYLLASWLVTETVAPAVRVTRVSFTEGETGTTVLEAGLGWYPRAHALAWTNAVVGRLNDDAEDDVLIQSQVQLLL